MEGTETAVGRKQYCWCEQSGYISGFGKSNSFAVIIAHYWGFR